MSTFDQAEFDVRFEWGLHGLETLAPVSDAVVIVDVLSFSTCVSIAVDRGASVFPYRWRDESAAAYARSVKACLAVPRGAVSQENPYSLSPKSMLGLSAGSRVVLPSANGSHLSFAARGLKCEVFAGCIRNAAALARAVLANGRTVAVIAAGERWDHKDVLRPAAEDLIGAGAIVRELSGSKSPEAHAAVGAFEAASGRLAEFLLQTSSGKELVSAGFGEDVTLASEANISRAVPTLRGDVFVRLAN